MSTFTSHLINWGCNPFLEQVTWFVENLNNYIRAISPALCKRALSKEVRSL